MIVKLAVLRLSRARALPAATPVHDHTIENGEHVIVLAILNPPGNGPRLSNAAEPVAPAAVSGQLVPPFTPHCEIKKHVEPVGGLPVN